jgi:hypothetical protein
MKCEKGHKWRYDADFARRSQEAVQEESSDDSSVEMVGHRGSSTRPQIPLEGPTAAPVLNGEALDRLVGSSESACVHLAALEGKLDTMITETRKTREENLETRRLCLKLANTINQQMARSWLEMRRLIGPQREGELLPTRRQILAAAEDVDVSEAELAALKETEEQRVIRVATERIQKEILDNPPYSSPEYNESSP